MMQVKWAVFAVAAGLATGAQAQVPAALIQCARLVEDAARLACYDKAVTSLSAEAREAGTAREAETAKVAAAAAAAATAAATKAKADESAAFGREAVAGAQPEERLEEITSTVQEVLRDVTGKSVFILENGQMWRQVDGFPLPNLKPGVAVSIKRAALGGYRLVVGTSNRTAQVKRMR